MTGDAKVCTKCGVGKPNTSEYFNKRSDTKAGLNTMCKECVHQIYKAKYKADPSAFNQRSKRYYEQNKDEMTSKHKQYSQEHSESLKQYYKKYSSANREKISEKNKQRYLDSKESINLQGKLYREANAEKVATRHKRYYEANKSKAALRAKIYNKEHKDQIAKRAKRYYEANKERIAERGSKYAKEHKDVVVAKRQRRVSAKQGLPSSFTVEQWVNCKEHFSSKCCYCGKSLPLCQDHFIALSKGGSYTKDNIVPSCQSCNSSKFDREFSEWYPKQRYYSKRREQAIIEYLTQEHRGEQISFELQEATS